MHSKTAGQIPMPEQTSYSTGLIAEWRARIYLRCHGFRILKSRYVTGRYTGRAEIDLIASRGNLIIFVEVKQRPTLDAACNAVTPTQIRRLRRAAETYLMSRKWTGDARFDIIAVCGRKIHWVKSAI